jgi:hypothetical protein
MKKFFLLKPKIENDDIKKGVNKRKTWKGVFLIYEKNFKKVIIIFLMFCTLFFVVGSANNKEVKQMAPDAIKGVMNLANWNFENYGNVKLNGAWEFYWEQLLTPEDFQRIELKDQVEYVNIPNFWNQNIQKRRPVNGYGTYRLEVVATMTPKSMALHIPLIQSAYKLWVNDELVNENGVVGDSGQTTVNRVKNTFEIFILDTNRFYLTIQVANFSEANGGIGQSIELGEAKKIVQQR